MRTIALDIEVRDLRPEYVERAPWHILGSDVMMYLDGRWGPARTRREIVGQAREIARRYRGDSNYAMTLVGYDTLGTGTSVHVTMGVEV